jgi:tetratricopeptide (TPR) repeat protein
LDTPPHSASLPGQLNHLEQSDLIRLAASMPELEYIFRHALIRDSVYHTLVRADRRRVHHAAGEALEAALAGGAPSPALAAMLARHFDEAADYTRALGYYRLAGDAALAGYANAEAVTAFTSALTAAEKSSAGAEPQAVPSAVWQHLFEARGRAFELSSEFIQALENYQAMTQRAAALGDRRLALAAAVATGQLYATSTVLLDLKRAERMAAEALAEARDLGDEPAEAKILWNQLNLYRFTRRYALARESGERSLEIARRLQLDDLAAGTVNDLIHVYAAVGLWPEFERSAGEAQQRWQALGNSAMLADSLSTSALYFGMAGQLASALARAQEAYRLTTAIGNRWGQAYGLFTGIWPYWLTGQPGRAIETARECIRLGREAWPFVVESAGAWLAVIYAELGDLASGQAVLAEVGSSDGSDGLNQLGSRAARVLLTLRSAGLPAVQELLEPLEQIQREPLPWELDVCLRTRAALAEASAEAAQVLEVMQGQVAQLRGLGLTTYLPEALARLAQAWLRLGRVPEARAALAEALALAQAIGASMVEWRLLYALGGLEAEDGQAAQAEQAWQPARVLLREIAGRLPDPALRRSFLAQPEARALLGE